MGAIIDSETVMREISTNDSTELIAFAGYREFETAADKTAIKIKEGFMEMGYILKIARDTDILAGSEYTSHTDFALRRYDLDETVVSRYIRIVERFSVDGNSHILKDNYRRMGFAKLSLMLHMPDEIAEELMDSLSKQEILTVKEELDKEKAISDIELCIERADVEDENEQESLLQKAIRQLGREQKDLYKKLWDALNDIEPDRIVDILAPQGDAICMVRIPGTGRLMISISEERVSVTVVRTKEKEIYTLKDVIGAVMNICRTGAGTAANSYWEIYGEEMTEVNSDSLNEDADKKSQLAPVQVPKPRKTSKVTKANTGHTDKRQAAAVVEPEVQLEGQMSVEDYPEIMPDAEEQNTKNNIENMEENNEQSNEKLSNINEMSRGAGDAYDAGMSGNNETSSNGAESAPHETIHEPDAGTGTTESGGREADIRISEQEGSPAAVVTEESWENLWDQTAENVFDLDRFFNRLQQREDFINNVINKVDFEDSYQKAIAVAAALERMLNGQKYSTQ